MIPRAIVKPRDNPVLDLAPRTMSLFWIFAVVLGGSISILDREPADNLDLELYGDCCLCCRGPGNRCLDDPMDEDVLLDHEPSRDPVERQLQNWVVADTEELVTGKLRRHRFDLVSPDPQ